MSTRHSHILKIEEENKESTFGTSCIMTQFPKLPKRLNNYASKVFELAPNLSVLRIIVEKDRHKQNAYQTDELHGEFIFTKDGKILTKNSHESDLFMAELRRLSSKSSVNYKTKYFDLTEATKEKKSVIVYKDSNGKFDNKLEFILAAAEIIASSYFSSKNKYAKETSMIHQIDDIILQEILREVELL
jgi:hypothetical protein